MFKIGIIPLQHGYKTIKFGLSAIISMRPALRAKSNGHLLSAAELAERARALGFIVGKTTITNYARMGRELDPKRRGEIVVPHAERVPGKSGFFFPEPKILDILAALPVRVVPPEGAVSMRALEKAARARGLPLDWGNINAKFRKMLRGEEPLPAGLSSDPFRRWLFIPKDLARQILAEAELKRDLPQFLRQGVLVPLLSVGQAFGVLQSTIFRTWRLPRVKSEKTTMF